MCCVHRARFRPAWNRFLGLKKVFFGIFAVKVENCYQNQERTAKSNLESRIRFLSGIMGARFSFSGWMGNTL
jgi:hypothetical protein